MSEVTPDSRSRMNTSLALLVSFVTRSEARLSKTMYRPSPEINGFVEEPLPGPEVREFMLTSRVVAWERSRTNMSEALFVSFITRLFARLAKATNCAFELSEGAVE